MRIIGHLKGLLGDAILPPRESPSHPSLQFGARVPPESPARPEDRRMGATVTEAEISQEIALLSARLHAPDYTPPTPPMLVDVDGGTAVWRVTTKMSGEVFMSAMDFSFNASMFIVHCDADRLLLAWLRSGNYAIPRQAMPMDYKYESACAGFARGRTNPVPVANATAHDILGTEKIGFNNGITRTYWLLSNEAPSLPVRVCGTDSAALLHRLAGIGNGPVSFSGLFAAQDCAMRP